MVLNPDQLAAVKKILRDPHYHDESASTSTSQPRFTQIICLGIGITSESRESQFQFILLDMLKEAFEVSQPDLVTRQS